MLLTGACRYRGRLLCDLMYNLFESTLKFMVVNSSIMLNVHLHRWIIPPILCCLLSPDRNIPVGVYRTTKTQVEVGQG